MKCWLPLTCSGYLCRKIHSWWRTCWPHLSVLWIFSQIQIQPFSVNWKRQHQKLWNTVSFLQNQMSAHHTLMMPNTTLLNLPQMTKQPNILMTWSQKSNRIFQAQLTIYKILSAALPSQTLKHHLCFLGQTLPKLLRWQTTSVTKEVRNVQLLLTGQSSK